MDANDKGPPVGGGDDGTPRRIKLRRRRRPLGGHKTSLKPNAPKLTLAQRLQVIEWLAWGWPAAKVQRALVEAGCPKVSLVAIGYYRKTHKGEIEAAREAWHKGVRDEPLAHVRPRVREYVRQYGLCCLAQVAERCLTCGGTGTIPSLVVPVDAAGKPAKVPSTGGAGRRIPAEPVKATRRCETCKGRRWVVPADYQRYVALLEGDVRLETLPELPPGISGEWMDRAADRLAKIREEVGDHFSPREKGEAPEGGAAGDRHLHLHAGDVAGLTKLLEQIRTMPAEHAVAIYQTPPRAGAGGDGRGGDGTGLPPT